jgi:hypothetical protein
MNINSIYSTCNIVDYNNQLGNLEIFDNPDKERILSVSKIAKDRNPQYSQQLLNLIDIKIINIYKSDNCYNYENLIKFGCLYEDMRTYYSILIPMIVEFRIKKEINIFFKRLTKNGDEIPLNIISRYENLLSNNNKMINEWMELSVYIDAITTFHFQKITQIHNYDWVDINFIEKSIDRYLEIIPEKGIFEFPMIISIDSLRKLEGRIDYLTNETIWEFKNCRSLSIDHQMQCAAYVSMYYLINNKLLVGKLFNSKTLELIEITVKDPKLFIEILVKDK